MSRNKYGSADWQIHEIKARYHSPADKRINFQRRFILTKRRWAGQALEWAGIPKEERDRWTRIDIPGTPIVVFAPPVTERGLLHLDPTFIMSQRAYHDELFALLDAPDAAGDPPCVNRRPIDGEGVNRA